ncbi:MAG: Fic family protein [Candidatus Eisenbacteria bacterium]|nr:Fic family protein [Candidatus Eisenbacteria bacterium]
MTALRSYATTHPWITFRVDLGDVTWDAWLLLGEARSKIDHLSQIPLRPDTFEQLHIITLARGALASAAIEGNTLSEEQAIAIAKHESHLPPSQEYLEHEVANVIDASNWVMDRIDDITPVLSPDTIKAFNRMVLDGLELESGVVPGEYRESPVGVGTVYRGAPAEDCEYLIDEMCVWLNHKSFAPDDPEQRVVFAIIRAVLAHLYIAWIHPFGDGNGRTARLTEFLILVSAGVPSTAAHLLSNHYNQTRDDYYRQLKNASRSGGDVIPLLSYAVRGLVDQLREQLKFVYGQVVLDSWQNYVHEALPGGTTTAERRRQLVIDLSPAGTRGWSKNEIASVSPGVAARYAQLSSRTLSRDLNDLVERGLLRRGDDDLYYVNLDTLVRRMPRSTERIASPWSPNEESTGSRRRA